MALHCLSKPQAVATVDGTVAQGHPRYWREGKRMQANGRGSGRETKPLVKGLEEF